MVQAANRHSELPAEFWGVRIAAKTPGAVALKTALDTLFNHPNVGPFFRAADDPALGDQHNPSPAYVARVSAAFADNGAGVRGDLKAVFAAILLDDEARSPAGLSQAQWGRLARADAAPRAMGAHVWHPVGSRAVGKSVI